MTTQSLDVLEQTQDFIRRHIGPDEAQTQAMLNEIAEHLGITQSAVHKALHGNIDYKNDKKRYGGVYKKIKKICLKDERVLSILQDIEDHKNKND